MKCKSPFMWFVQCLKSTWRLLFGRKRVNSGSGQGLASSSSTIPAGAFTGITVNTITPGGSGGLQLANEDDAWNNNWGQDGQSPRGTSKNFFSAPNPSVAGPRTSAADAWRQAQLQQKAAPPEIVEEPNFFDSMAPKVQKQKIIRLRSDVEEATTKAQSPRLTFSVAAPPVNQFDWMEDESPAGNWEAAIDDLDPKEIRKAQRNAQSTATVHPQHSSRSK